MNSTPFHFLDGEEFQLQQNLIKPNSQHNLNAKKHFCFPTDSQGHGVLVECFGLISTRFVMFKKSMHLHSK
jgi:hypothetical protein